MHPVMGIVDEACESAPVIYGSRLQLSSSCLIVTFWLRVNQKQVLST